MGGLNQENPKPNSGKPPKALSPPPSHFPALWLSFGSQVLSSIPVPKQSGAISSSLVCKFIIFEGKFQGKQDLPFFRDDRCYHQIPTGSGNRPGKSQQSIW
jgi:hypothetical protein